VSLALFAAVFPVFYVIYKNSVIHDGWRHLTFAYPAMAVCAGLFWNELANFFSEKKYIQWAVYGAIGTCSALMRGPLSLCQSQNAIRVFQSYCGRYQRGVWGI
jgi:hypothetical protein